VAGLHRGVVRGNALDSTRRVVDRARRNRRGGVAGLLNERNGRAIAAAIDRVADSALAVSLACGCSNAFRVERRGKPEDEPQLTRRVFEAAAIECDADRRELDRNDRRGMAVLGRQQSVLANAIANVDGGADVGEPLRGEDGVARREVWESCEGHPVPGVAPVG